MKMIRNNNTHRNFTVHVDTGRKCILCGRDITEIPRDQDPNYVKWCMDCREAIARREPSGEEWIGAGRESGADTGFLIIR
jgi:hypothetical protein